MRVLVCGGRDYTDAVKVATLLQDLEPKLIIEGGARGADTLARLWAEAHRVSCLTVPAEWKQHGKRAGVFRNRRMLEVGRPDLVLAFPGGRGTADMVRRAKAAGCRVIEVAA